MRKTKGFVCLVGKRFNRLTVLSELNIDDVRFWKCICDCGNIKNVVSYRLKNGHIKSCGCLAKETASDRMVRVGKKFGKINGKKNLGKIKEQNSRWKGGISVHKGYKTILISGKYILEHRYIVEQSISRKLSKDEVVHHINGDKKDNSLKNLLLLANQSEHMKVHKSNGYSF